MTKIMGILNVTDNSFHDGGANYTKNAAIKQGLQLAKSGADIIDIGGESTWITSAPVPLEEELTRVIPVIEALKEKVSTPLSIDTTKPQVALEAVKRGASIINDISGFRNPQMREVAASTGALVSVMHMQGTPQTMQKNPYYLGGVVEDILKWLEEHISLLLKEGVKEKNITIDPGIGFGKTVADNYEILHNISKFKTLGFPLLIGISRKSFIYKIAGKPPGSNEVLAATMVLNALCYQAQVEIIRVHDVAAHRQVINVLENKA